VAHYSEVPLSLSVSPILDEKGRVTGASKIARDMSELLASQADRELLYQEVSALNEKKDEFIDIASHALKHH
jgi:transcriptional regulator of acetoin/glycerol metabolism